MLHLLNRSLVVAVALATLLAVAGRSVGQPPAEETFAVAETYNNDPFEYRIRLLAERDGFRVYRLSYPSPVVTPHESNNTVSADFYVPISIKPGDAKRPAVICLHVLNGNEQASDYACSTMALRGIPALAFRLPYYGQRAIDGGWRVLLQDPDLFLSAFRQAIEDTRRTVDLLGSRPEIDARSIGLMGFSLGGVIAASAAGAEPRLRRAAIFAAGGDILEIVRQARYTQRLSEILRQMPADQQADFRSRVETIEPLRFAPALRERAEAGKVLMLNAAEDDVIPRACTERLAEALGIADRVTWLDGVNHETFLGALPRIAPAVIDFFAEDLPPGVEPYRPATPERSAPSQQVVGLLRQAVAMLGAEPEPGRCHRMKLQVELRREDQDRPVEWRVEFVRGEACRFVLRCALPVFGDVLVGQGEYPWMAVAGRQVLAGVKNPIDQRNPLCFANQRHVARFHVAEALVEGLTNVPDAIEQWADVQEEKTPGEERNVRVAVKHRSSIAMTVAFGGDDGAAPRRVAYDILGHDGTIVIDQWQYGVAADPATFEPPAELKPRNVDQADLYRLFSTVFNLMMESVE